MKRILVVTMALLVGVGGTGICHAADSPQQDKPGMADQEKPGDARKTALFHGIVGKVKLKAKTIEVMRENRDIGLLFDASKAKFRGYKSLKDVKVNDKVTVEYDVIKGQNIAVVITKEK
jgi:hypothetical protein